MIQRLIVMIQRLIVLVLAAGLAASCASKSSVTDTTADTSKPSLARFVLLDEHPFDIEAALEFGPVRLERVLRFLDERDTDTIDTNYDNLKSLILVVRGPVAVGTKIQMKFTQYVRGRRNDYEIVNEVPPGSATDPAIFINSYRNSVHTDVTVRAIMNGEEIARHSFDVRGPSYNFGGEWNARDDYRLTASDLREFLIGKRFRLDTNGAILSYGADSRYTYSSARGESSGSYRIGEDGFLCLDLDSGRSRCDIVILGADGHPYLVNKRSRRYRMKEEG